MQKNFSHNAAHEFRTPLAILKTRIGLFQKKRDFGPEATRDFLQIMEGEVDRLSALVESLLELTNLEAAERAAQVSIDALIRDAAGEAALSAAARDVSIQTDISPCVLPGNERLLHRAVFNLLENAVKHSPAGGTVRVSGHLADGRFRLDVSDRAPAFRRTSAAGSLSPSSVWTMPAPASRAVPAWGLRWCRRSQRRTAARSAWRSAPQAAAGSSWSCPVRCSRRPARRPTGPNYDSSITISPEPLPFCPHSAILRSPVGKFD